MPLRPHLLVDVGPVVDQQLQAEGAVGGDGGQVQRGEAAAVGLVDVGPVVHQLRGHRLLAHVASHEQGRVAEAVGLINLKQRWEET